MTRALGMGYVCILCLVVQAFVTVFLIVFYFERHKPMKIVLKLSTFVALVVATFFGAVWLLVCEMDKAAIEQFTEDCQNGGGVVSVHQHTYSCEKVHNLM